MVNCPLCGAKVLEFPITSVDAVTWVIYICKKKCFIDIFPADKPIADIKKKWARRNPGIPFKDRE